MTPDEYVFSALLTSGLPGTKYAWPLGGAPALPWFTYKHRRGGEVFADDSTYEKMRRYEVNLYEREQDDGVRESLEEALGKIGPYAEEDSWITSENCWVTSYSVTYHHNNT